MHWTGFARDRCVKECLKFLVWVTAGMVFLPSKIGKSNFGWKIRSAVLDMSCLRSLLIFLVEISSSLHRSGTLKRRQGRISQFLSLWQRSGILSYKIGWLIKEVSADNEEEVMIYWTLEYPKLGGQFKERVLHVQNTERLFYVKQRGLSRENLWMK